MTAAALVVAALAAILHVYIFVMESVTWTSPRTRAVFRMSEEEAQTTRLLALNQGYYNLFLAIATGAGIVATAAGADAVGAALLYAGLGSMLAAAVVLVVSARDKARAAVMQGTLPLVAIVLLLLASTL
ncbi:DUF1304 domain-containing protein [Mycobacterium kyogaense]|uniref:DUF1304 domain-containing protein n=1 Tax=Mycobacterium kyogaense TaxID=2212479 RepID=UPI000DAF02BB|nr:DUF1304 domain-containing protein [Mycobacterium kyogaense]